MVVESICEQQRSGDHIINRGIEYLVDSALRIFLLCAAVWLFRGNPVRGRLCPAKSIAG